MGIKNNNPMHPGQVLEVVFMADHNLNQTDLAKKLKCAPNKISEIVNGKRGISTDFALQLEELFGMDANVWIRMQGEYDVWLARKTKDKRRTGHKKTAVAAPSAGGRKPAPRAACSIQR